MLLDRTAWRGIRIGLFCLLLMNGCTVRSTHSKQNAPFEQLLDAYRAVHLRISSASEIQARIEQLEQGAIPKGSIVRGENVLACVSRNDDERSCWFGLFTFAPEDTTSSRKVLYYLNERTRITPTEPRRVLFPSRKVLIFDTEVVLSEKVRVFSDQATPYMAVLKKTAVDLLADIRRVRGMYQLSNNPLEVSGLLMNQVLRDALLALERTPALIQQLDGPAGVPFTHTSLGQGRLSMEIMSETAWIHIEIGLPEPKDAKPFDS